MEDFQNILVSIGYPLNQYINTTPYVGDNVVFLVNYNGKYYALPSWYAGESNGNYYFFINLLNIPSLYNNNIGCNIISIFVGFSNENLLPYLNGTIGGDPYALNPRNPSSAIIYDNGLNVFPIYVNFYPYNGNIEEQEIPCNNGFEVCFNNTQFNNVLPPYNNVNIYLNGTGVNIKVVTNGPLQGLVMDNGTNQGSYALITSDVLQNTFSKLSQSQNGLGLQTFAYFSGIPWEDSPSTGINPLVSDAIVLSYVSYNNQFYADTVNNYNSYDYATNCDYSTQQCAGNTNIGINVGGYTYLPLNFPVFMYEYAWVSGSPGPGSSSGYYVGILQYNNTPGLGYFLTTQYNSNPCSSNPCTSGYFDYYYSGSGWGYSACLKFPPVCYNLYYYFLEDNTGKTNGYSGSKYFAFMPPDQQKNKNYYQYGVFWLYNWFQAENNNMNIFFLMNGNIFNYSLALQQYNFNGYSANAIPPMPPAYFLCPLTGECGSLFVKSYINAYNTAFNQSNPNYQKALNNYNKFTYSDVNSNFVPGTFGYKEEYIDNTNPSNSITIHYLQDIASVYDANPYLFISAGSGGGSGFMYLDWVIVTYGVPYIISLS